MIRKKIGSIEWLEFELLAEFPEVRHGVFLRHGGTSQDSYASLNVIKGTGDDLECVEENRRRILKTFHLESMIFAREIHSSQVEHVTEAVAEFPNCDGLITTQKNWGLMISHADCQAALFYDPIHKAVGNVHAGWRGQVKNIYRQTVVEMKRLFQTDPEDLLVAVSPSLGPENSEFIHFQKELPQEFWPFQIKPTYFDLWAIARHQLEECGILSHHIQIASIDTYAHPEDFFSYRREKTLGKKEKITGGHGSVIALLS